MSEQQGGILELPTSYNFARDTTAQYRSRSIDPANFTQWHKDNMYKSSYAHFHSKVTLHLHRILLNRRTLLFLVMVDTFPMSFLRIFMRKDLVL